MAKDKYKIEMQFLVGEGPKAQNVVVTAKIMKVDDNKVAIDI